MPVNSSSGRVQLTSQQAQPLWFAVDILATAPTGKTSTTVTVLDDKTGKVLAVVELWLEVWALEPLRPELGSFVDADGFDDHSLTLLYPNVSTKAGVTPLAEATRQFDKALCAHHMPASLGIRGAVWFQRTSPTIEAEFMEHFKMLVDPQQCNQRLAMLLYCGVYQILSISRDLLHTCTAS